MKIRKFIFSAMVITAVLTVNAGVFADSQTSDNTVQASEEQTEPFKFGSNYVRYPRFNPIHSSDKGQSEIEVGEDCDTIRLIFSEEPINFYLNVYSETEGAYVTQGTEGLEFIGNATKIFDIKVEKAGTYKIGVAGNNAAVDLAGEIQTVKAETGEETEEGNQSADSENAEIVPLSEEESAKVLREQEIMIGDPDGNMRLDGTLTRAESMILILRTLDKDYADTQINAQTSYTDIADHWAYEDIKHAIKMGLIEGTDEKTVEPDREVTGEEFIKMIVNALGYQSDVETLGGYPDGYVQTAEALGLLKGVDTVSETSITRGEAAVMLNNALDIPIMQTTGLSYHGEYLMPDYQIMNGENGTELITLKTRR